MLPADDPEEAVVDAECQRGLQRLRELLSHVDSHLTFGQLVRLVREADGSRHFAGRLAGRRRLWGSVAQERPRAAAGQPYFGAESALRRGPSAPGAPALRWRQSRLRRRSPAWQPAV